MKESKTSSWHWSHLLSASILTQRFAQLSLKASKVYIVLKVRCNLKTGVAFPSLKRISQDTGISVSSVQRALKELESAGYIESFKDRRSKIYMLYEVFETGQGEIVRKLYVPANFKALIEDAKKEIQESKLKKNESVTPVFSSNSAIEDIPTAYSERLLSIKEGIVKKALH